MLIVINEEKKPVSAKRYVSLKVGRIKSLLIILTHRGEEGRGEKGGGDRDPFLASFLQRSAFLCLCILMLGLKASIVYLHDKTQNTTNSLYLT